MKRSILIAVSFVILVIFFGIGLPVEMRVGKVNKVGDKIHFYTNSRSLASIIGRSKGAYVQCHEKRICVTPVNRDHFDANVPIVFEVCEVDRDQLAPECNNAVMGVKSDTSNWLKAGLRK